MNNYVLNGYKIAVLDCVTERKEKSGNSNGNSQQKKEIKKLSKEMTFNSPIQRKRLDFESPNISSPNSTLSEHDQTTNAKNVVKLSQTLEESNRHQNKKQKLRPVVIEKVTSDLLPFNKKNSRG